MKNHLLRGIGRHKELWKHFTGQASLEEIREAAGRICRDYLTGRWKVVTADQLIVKRISGGLSNFLYYVSLPDEDNTTTQIIQNGSATPNMSDMTDGNDTVGVSSVSLFAMQDKNRNENENVSMSGTGINANNKRQRTDSGSSVGVNGNAPFLKLQQNEPKEVLLRIYGQSHGEDALEAMITESVVFALLSERNFGPKLHGIFPGGRIEQYIKARALATKELSDPKISMKIAEKMGEIHSLNIPMSKEPDWLWNCMDRWLKSVNSILNTITETDDQIQFVRAFKFYEETKWLKSVIEKGNYTVLFCHNDLQEGNILYRECVSESQGCELKQQASGEDTFATPLNALNIEERELLSKRYKIHNDIMNTPLEFDSTQDSALSTTSEDIDPDLIIIDFEYCAYNYRGFDLANHFLEWTFDYSNSKFPFYYHHKHQYPTKQQRQDFIINYLKKLNEGIVEHVPTVEEIEQLEQEVRLFSMFSHLFWSLWSVVNVTSNIEFGYWDYAETRIREFNILKQAYISNDIIDNQQDIA